MNEKKELLSTKTEEEFNQFLLKYHPEYDEIAINEWNDEIKKHYLNKIINMTMETINKMQKEIIEYELVD